MGHWSWNREQNINSKSEQKNNNHNLWFLDEKYVVNIITLNEEKKILNV